MGINGGYFPAICRVYFVRTCPAMFLNFFLLLFVLIDVTFSVLTSDSPPFFQGNGIENLFIKFTRMGQIVKRKRDKPIKTGR